MTVSHDTQSRVESISSLVDSINTISSFLESDTDISRNFKSDWFQLVSDATSSLARYGIEMGSDRQLSLNTKKLNSELNENIIPAREAIGGENGLGRQIEPFLAKTVSSPGADLLESQPASNFATLYLRLITSNANSGNVSSTFNTVA